MDENMGEKTESRDTTELSADGYRNAMEYELMKYKLTSDALDIALWDMDVVNLDPLAPNNKFTWSQEFRHKLGFKDEHDFPDVLQSWSNRLHPEDKEMTLNALAAHLNDRSGGTPYDVEYRLMMKNGNYRNFQAFGTTQRDSAGTPLRVAGALMDITEKKQMIVEIRDAHARAKLMLDATPLACRLWDKEFNIFELNEEAVKLFKAKDKKEVIDNYFAFSPEYQPDGQNSREKAIAILQKTFEEGRYILEWMHKASDGTPIPTEITLVRVKFGNEDVIAGYTRDLREHKKMMAEIEKQNETIITEKKKTEAALNEAQKANSAKTTFLANMSHEMRTPLNAVIGLSALTLEADRLNDEDRVHIETIYNAGSTLLSTVNDILDISKIEAGKLELVPVEYEVPSLINDAVTQNVMRIGDKPIELILDLDGDLFSHLYGDELRIKQIINNLLSNAIKYTREGTVELVIRNERENDSVRLMIQVRDSGVGIRPRDIEKLFAEYMQIDMESNRKIEGTGLGLPLTKSLAALMDGTINVESEYGKGSTFTINVRQGFVADARIGEQAVESLKNFRYSNNKHSRDTQIKRVYLPYARVLVVDDNLTNLIVAKGLMKPYGMKIDCVDGGQKAVDAVIAEEVRYDAIFMDHMMPGMDGMETAQAIRNIGTDYALNVPIIALTANATVGNEEMFLNNGFQAFLTKPIIIPRLDEVIRHWVRNKELEKTLTEEQFIESGFSEARKLDGRQIAGLDIEKGIERFSGDEEVYLEVLRSFTANTRNLLESMENVREETLAEYAIVVHGIKGSSRGIFADVVGNAAEELEHASKAGDFEYVSAHNRKFIDDTRNLIRELEDLLASIGDDGQKQIKDKPDAETLSDLLAACEAFAMEGVYEAMKELENFEYESGNEFILWLRENVDMMNYMEIAERLRAQLIEGGNIYGQHP